jgi:hypothetical protein
MLAAVTSRSDVGGNGKIERHMRFVPNFIVDGLMLIASILLPMDIELLRPGTARPSHNTVLWFEFLLDPSLLENHLQKETPGNVAHSFIGN